MKICVVSERRQYVCVCMRCTVFVTCLHVFFIQNDRQSFYDTISSGTFQTKLSYQRSNVFHEC